MVGLVSYFFSHALTDIGEDGLLEDVEEKCPDSQNEKHESICVGQRSSLIFESLGWGCSQIDQSWEHACDENGEDGEDGAV